MTIENPNSLSWADILRGTRFDPANDQQANAGNDLVGSAGAAMLQGQIAGTGADTTLYFRARLGDASASTSVYVGLDLNLDGRIDIFIEGNNTNSGPFVSFHAADPSVAGTGPSNTAWLSTAQNSASERELAEGDFYLDSSNSAGTDLDGNGQTDSWIQFGFKLSELSSFISLALNGQTLDANTPLAMYVFTSTSQTSNGDTGGVNDTDSAQLNSTWLDLGVGQVGSLNALLTGALVTPTVEKLSTSDSSPLISGTWGGDFGGSDSLSVTVDGVTYTTANGLTISGTNWSLQLPVLDVGTYSVAATANRSGGGTASDGTTGELTVVAPGDTTAPTLTLSSPTDNATGVARGSDIVLTFSEPVVAGSGFITLGNSSGTFETFSLATGKGSLGGTVSISGNLVTLNPGALLSAATDYFIKISGDALTDASGNAYAGISTTTALNFTTASALGSPSAPSVTALTTYDTSPVLTGTWGGSNGGVDTLSVSVNGTTYTTANGLVIDGTSWSLQLPTLATGNYDVTATASRTDGGTTNDSTNGELSITVYAGAPTAPTVTPQLSSSHTPTLTGTWGGAQGGTDSLSVTVDGVTYTTEDGLSIEGTTWSLTLPSHGDGTFEVTATAARVSGDTVSDTSTLELTIDTTAPTVTATISAVTDNVGDRQGTVPDGGISDDSSPNLNGTLSAALGQGEVLAVYVNGVKVGEATVEGTTWTFADSGRSLGDSLVYTVAVVDAAGNTGPVSDSYAVDISVIDTVALVTLVTDDRAETPVSVANNGLTEDTSPIISGTLDLALQEGQVLVVYRDGGGLGLATIGEDPLTWSFADSGLTAGTTYAYSVRIVSTDNDGAMSPAYSISISTGTPQAPTVTPYSGNDPTPTISGTWGGAQDGSDVLTVTVDGVDYTTANGLVIEGTTWSLTLPTELEDGTYSVTATASREGGGSATDATGEELTIDTTEPPTLATATITSVTDNAGQSTSDIAPGGTTDDLTPTLGGTLSDPLPSGQVVTVYRDGEAIGTATVDGTSWTFTDPGATNRTTSTYTVAVTDGSGNAGATSSGWEVEFASNEDLSLSVDASGLDRFEGTLPRVNGVDASTPFSFSAEFDTALAASAEIYWRVVRDGNFPVETEDFMGYDNVLPSGTVTMEAGESTFSVTIDVRSDAAWARDQGFRIELTSNDPLLSLPSDPILGVIRNDDALSGSAASEVLKAADGNDTINGLGGNDLLQGMGGDDTLNGGTGNDSLDGGAGDDMLSGDAGQDVVIYTSATSDLVVNLALGTATGGAEVGTDVLAGIEGVQGGSGNDLITGTGAAEVFSGGSGNDTILAGDGNDTVRGDAGTDTLSFANLSAAVAVNLSATMAQAGLGAGMITVIGFENLVGGNGADTLTGSSAANRIDGGAGNDLLNGGAGADVLVGGTGNDTFTVDAADTVIELDGEGTDLVQSALSYTLVANVENLTLIGLTSINGTGNSLDNLLTGNASANVLNGVTGSDTMVGGGGNDVYVTDGGDTITELAAGGTDTVQSTVSFTLGSNLENLTLLGLAAISGTGNTVNNTLTGNGAGNLLDGAGGTDTMQGGAGDDIYVTDGGDLIIELSSAGFDIVRSSVSYVLGGNLEALELTGTSAINGTGNGLANSITGNAGNNVLNGTTGNDTLAGGAGNDTYVTDGGDTIIEALGEGVDVVQSRVSLTLADNLETLFLTGTSAIDGTGNGLDNLLYGNTAKNTLAGGGGSDTIIGGGGTDYLTGGAGSDSFVFTAIADSSRGTGRDVIMDFAAGIDRINLSSIDPNTRVSGDQAFTFTGAVGTAYGVWFVASTGRVIVSGDTSGDRVADFEIAVNGVNSLTALDFIL